MTPTLTLYDKPDPAVARAVHALLLAFNNTASGYEFDGQALVIGVKDHDAGEGEGKSEIIGGPWGSTSYGYLHIDMLIVPESLRRTGLGTRMMQQAEQEAIRRGCHASYLDTFDFQARGFYERLGYTVFGALEDTPPGHTRFFLRKKLTH
ncbi:MAG TPA: GNAT family N-acetyltransferase [Acidobacteriaceae bacterium]|nr:GNAT family N-acetyltransferase [Acidobacteriaceae bacterium]